MIENLSALSGVAYEKSGAIFPFLVAPKPAPTARCGAPDSWLRNKSPLSNILEVDGNFAPMPKMTGHETNAQQEFANNLLCRGIVPPVSNGK
jgi:hypothetical protein